MQFLAFCDDTGKFSVADRAGLQRYVREHFTGKGFVVDVKAKPRRQGSQQLRYYRGVVVPDIATACGYSDPDDWQQVHESLAWKFLRIADHPQLGYPRRRSTAKNDLSSDEMTDYISRCIQWAEAEIPGCRIRRPDEVDDLDNVHAPDYEEAA